MTEEEKRLLIALEAHKAMNDMRAMIGLEPDNSFLERLKAEGVDLPDMSTPLPEQTEDEYLQEKYAFFEMISKEEERMNEERMLRGEEPAETTEQRLTRHGTLHRFKRPE